MSQMVKITVCDGVAYVDKIPPGVVVQVTDYDVDPRTPERDEEGTPCSRYLVEVALGCGELELLRRRVVVAESDAEDAQFDAYRLRRAEWETRQQLAAANAEIERLRTHQGVPLEPATKPGIL